jgi:transposase
MTLESRMRENAHVRFGGRESKKGYTLWYLVGSPSHHNLSDTVYLLLQQEAQAIYDQFAVTQKPLHQVPEKTLPSEKPLTPAEQRRKERMAQAEALRQQGWRQKEIARYLHIHPKTVRRYRNHPSPRFERTRTRHWIDAYQSYLLQRWNAGCHNAAQLYREIQLKGFRGHVTIVMDFVRTLREASGLPARVRKTTTGNQLPVDLVPTLPTLRTLTWWILKRPEGRLESDENILARICEGQPKLVETVAFARVFAAMIRQQQEDQLTPWLEQASSSKYPLWRGFAESLKQDEKAIRATLRFSWSNGPTEGHVNRLKNVKRLMYGRANDDLLRKRVLWQGKLAFT